MAVVEDIELRVTVDASAAQKGLEETRRAAESMGGRIDGLREQFGKFAQKLGPSAAAISGVATALGQTNGEAGKALAAVGQVTAAFAAGGPFGAALAAGVFAVDALSQSWERQIKEQDEALASLYRATDGYVKNLQTARGELAKARGEFATAARAGREFTPEERKQQLRDEAAGRIAAAEAATKQARAEVDLAKATEYAATLDMTFSQARALLEKTRASNIRIADRALAQEKEALQTRINAISVSETMRKKAEEERSQNEFLADSIAEIAAQNRAAAQAAAERERQTTGDVQALLAKEYASRLGILAEARKQIESERAAVVAEESAIRDAQLEDELDADINRWAAAGEAYKGYEQLKTSILEEESERRKQVAQQALGVIVGSTQDYIDARIKGEKDAEEAFAASIMRQAGQALVAKGVELGGIALVSLLSGNVAIAAAQGAGSAALITAGVGLGAQATSIMHTAAGGKVGQPLPTQSTSGGGTDIGARARPARPGTAGAGGTNLTIIYGGLSGPSADDGARALGKGLERARRRGIV